MAGFLCSWFVSGELEILNVAAAPAFRRRGVARSCCTMSSIKAGSRGWTGVSRGAGRQRGAIALYRSFGFLPIATRERYYADGEDALVMELREGKVGLD